VFVNIIPACCANPFLFRIEKEGVYTSILGTNHRVPLDSLPKNIVSYVKNHDVMITENKDVLTPITMDKLKKIGVLREIDEEDYFLLLNDAEKEELQKYAEPFMQYKKFPVNINVLNPTGLLQTYVGGHLMGMDYELINYFEKEKKSILGLESLEEVSTYFEQISLMNLKDIIEVKYGFGSIEEDEQIQRYLKGDLSIIQEDEIDEEVKQRNLSWIPNILDYHIMHGKEAIFCVGYSHLFGEFGLLNLLKENGFKITQSDNVGNFSLFNF
jgi:uncharacterized protein YbaP (TraB family)